MGGLGKEEKNSPLVAAILLSWAIGVWSIVWFCFVFFPSACAAPPERCPPFPPSPSGMFVSTLVFVRVASKRPRRRTVTVLRPPLPLHEVAVHPAPLLSALPPPPVLRARLQG